MSSTGTISFHDIKVIAAVCVAVSVVITVVRLYLRLRSGRVWWDDAWVLFSALSNIVMTVATILHYGPPFAYSFATRMAAYYLIAEGFYLTLWAARLSILFSIIRIVPDRTQLAFLKWVAGAFMAVLVFLLAQVFWVCEGPGKTAWQAQPNPQCSLGLQVAACQLVTDILADILLIVVPTRLLFQSSSLPGPLKARLTIIFGATVLTTVVGLVHAAYLLEKKGVNAIISALVEVAVCLIVCNGVVLLPAIYRMVGFRGDQGGVIDSDGHMHGERSYQISSFKFRNVSGWTSRIGTRTAAGLTTSGWTTGLMSSDEGTTLAGGPGRNVQSGTETGDLSSSSVSRSGGRVVEIQVPLPTMGSGGVIEEIELTTSDKKQRSEAESLNDDTDEKRKVSHERIR